MQLRDRRTRQRPTRYVLLVDACVPSRLALCSASHANLARCAVPNFQTV